jgi:hypothetical protein
VALRTVWFGGVMGLLDEAIREHLELKRRSGADPGAVAREEREVLAPVFPDEHAGPNGDGADPVEDATAELASPGFMADDGHSGENEALSPLSSVGQDTAELDMQAVMEEDARAPDAGVSVGAPGDEAAQSGYAGEMPSEDSLEWEVPSEQDGGSLPVDPPGQGRLSLD